MRIHKNSAASAIVAALCIIGSSDSLAGAVYQPAPQPVAPQGYSYPAVPGYNVPNTGVEYLAPNAPPPPQQEVIIASPGPGYVWIGGYWHWQNGWAWIPGQWSLPPGPGMTWHGPHWVPHRDGERYRMEHGGWR